MRRVFLAFCLLIACLSAQAQDALQVYYLVISSADYEHDSRKFREKDFIPYDDLPEATASVQIMTEVLKKYGKGRGITLYSSPERLMTKARVLKGIDSLEKLIRNEHPANPYVMIYYCGHGISENLGWNQFLVPGNYTAVAGTKSFDDLGKSLVHLSDITDKLDKAKRRYMLLVDCCRKEEKDNSLPEGRLRYFFSDQNVETFKTIVVALKYLNEYHHPNAVVFSIAPGHLAPTVDVPSGKLPVDVPVEQDAQVGPICRRTVLIIKQALAEHKSASISTYIQRITDASLDAQSATSISHYEADASGAQKLFEF